jgi:predicted TIM-barrel fold metal-dependent hydrolase
VSARGHSRLRRLAASINESLLRAWLEPLLAGLPGVALFDAHTHIGANDPDGARLTREQLIDILAPLDARGVVFAMHEPGGYREANDHILEEAARSDGRLVPFCRLDPNDGAVAEAARCVELGARGIKLHPRSDGFLMGSPEAREVFEFAGAHRLPVLVHAGRGIPALGSHTLEYSEQFPDARIILAHAAVSDLSWIWRHMPDHPNVLIDTSWWVPLDLSFLFSYVPPGQILFASDVPYGAPALNAILTMRCGLQAGLSPDQLIAVCGAQLERLLAGGDPIDLGPAPGPRDAERDPVLERVYLYAMVALGRMIAGAPADEIVAMAELAASVEEDAPQAAACVTLRELIGLQAEAIAEVGAEELATPSTQRLALLSPLLLAATLAATPDVPAPRGSPVGGATST